MSLRLNKRADSPGLKFTHPESGYTQQAWDIHTLIGLVGPYRRNNGFPPITQEEIEDAVCKSLPAEWCHQSTGAAREDFLNIRLSKEDVVRGTMALGEIAARRAASTLVPSWTPFVDQETAEARAAICAQCYARTPVLGCIACDAYLASIGAVIGDRHTKQDATLATSACGICKCSASAQVHIKAEILNRNVDDATLERFKAIPFCWKGKELLELRLTNQSSEATPAP